MLRIYLKDADDREILQEVITEATGIEEDHTEQFLPNCYGADLNVRRDILHTITLTLVDRDVRFELVSVDPPWIVCEHYQQGHICDLAIDDNATCHRCCVTDCDPDQCFQPDDFTEPVRPYLGCPYTYDLQKQEWTRHPQNT